MVLEEMREAARLVGRTPALWIPGVVAGLLGAVLWILYNISGAFFAGRLVILAGLVLVVFVAGTFGLIRNNGTGAGTLLREGVRSFFRVLLPWLVIIFILVLVAILVTILTIVTTGSSTDYTSAGILALIVMVPLLFMTFFCDTAAVFENLGVFKSLQRSIIVASTRGWEVLGFFIVSCAVAFIDLFFFAIVWEGLLFDKIQPLTTYNETQIASLTPQALVTL
ncbi:MAG: hypothetical protein LUQ31_04610, partial [Methanoregula sp.]|nr:hypothetical protein [Methanoregula sp.]